ncbi:MAG: CCA tRNA nucleotidyltransferase [Chloroflexia bacterium]|nr:CCA tRNA nucleotidyltransferase [Chloroflexia bacterium]
MPPRIMVDLILEQLVDHLEQVQSAAHFVGGSVRDLLLGRPLHDLDLVVAGPAMSLARSVANAFHGAFVPLDDEHDIARVVLRGRDEGPDITLDLARQRGPDLAADLAARDFTINAMAMRPADFVAQSKQVRSDMPLIDPWGGRLDLQRALLRAVRADAFREDPLRTLRGVRLAAELHFDLEGQTAHWAQAAAGLLVDVSGERVRDEWVRLLACAHCAPYLPLLSRLDLLPPALPAALPVGAGLEEAWETIAALEWLVASLEGRALRSGPAPLWQPAALVLQPALSLDLPQAVELRSHLCERLSAERSRLVLLKLAVLLSRPGEDGAAKAAATARRLRLSRQEGNVLRRILDLYARGEALLLQTRSGLDIYCLYRDYGETSSGALLLGLARFLALSGPALQLNDWQEWQRRVGSILCQRYRYPERVVALPSLLNGHDLRQSFDLPPGPRIGQLLEGLREAQAAGLVSSREQALAWVRQELRVG